VALRFLQLRSIEVGWPFQNRPARQMIHLKTKRKLPGLRSDELQFYKSSYVCKPGAVAAAAVVYGLIEEIGRFPVELVLRINLEKKETRNEPVHFIRTVDPPTTSSYDR